MSARALLVPHRKAAVPAITFMQRQKAKSQSACHAAALGEHEHFLYDRVP